MTQIVLGPKGTRRRRRTLFAPLFVVLAALVLAIAAAAGPIGTAAGFEDDDGNLIDNTAAGIDWNNFAPLSWTGTAPFRQADKTDLGWLFKGIEDDQASTADSGFAGGTKQDDNCATVIPAKAPNKDDLKRIYLATKVVGGHTFLELAWVRIPQNSVTASAHIGFEFSKGSTPCGAASGGLVQRTAGDMLIVYDFEGGSNQPTLTVRRWVLSGPCEVGSNTAPCWGQAINLTGSGFAEAAVNFGGTASDALAPNNPPETLGKVEFGEAGIDLTLAGVFGANTCTTFGKAYAVSRSSGSSGTAQMKDLVGPGNFSLSNCNAALVTDPKSGGNSVAGQTIQPGTSVTDLATITGTNNAGTPPTPTGSVTFSLCGPTATNSTDLCTTGGTTVSTNQVSAGQTQGTATATSAAVNTAQNPLLPGRYCFRADYTSGDANYGNLSHTGTGNSECFIVAKLPSSTATQSSPNSGSIVPGASATDTATITPTGGTGPTPTGTVDFYLCQPNQVTAGGCEGTAGTLISDDVALVNGSATSGSTTNTSAIGKYCWRAEYSGDTVYLSSTHTNSTTECFTTVKQPSTTATTSIPTGGGVTPGTSVTDTATVSGGAGQPTPTGTVDFYLCAPNEVTAGGCETGGTLISDDVALVSGSATSAAASPTTVGKYCWRAEYSGDGFYLASAHTNSTSECFTVQDSTAITSAQDWLPNDTGTVSANGGTPLNGTLSITLYESSDCTGTAVQGQSYSKQLTNATSLADRSLTTGNLTYKVLASATVSWKVEFTSTNSNVSGQTHCESTSLTIAN